MKPESETQLIQKIDRVLFILESDNRTNTKGLVERTADLEKKVGFLESDRKSFTTVAKTLKVVWGLLAAVGTFLLWLISKKYGGE